MAVLYDLLTGGLGLLLAARSLDAADELKSGPKPGEAIPGPLQSFNVTGDRADKFHCLVCKYGLGPAVLIFAREALVYGRLERRPDWLQARISSMILSI